jgi:hypothetical protein
MSETTEPTPTPKIGMDAFMEAIQKKDEHGKSLSDYMRESMDEFRKESNSFWDGLSYDDKLKAFFAVCERIHQGDIKDRGSYRHVLYQVFGFAPDAYSLGMECGYLDIHNCIYTEEDRKMEDERNRIANSVMESEQFMWLMAGSNHVESQLEDLRPAYMAWKDAGGKNIFKKEP